MSVNPEDRLGPYLVVSKLGEGGMGEVYRARDTRLGRDVAIKVLSAGFAKDEDRVRRFTIEAQATGALNHPNILAVHDIGTHEGTPYLVAELLEGETLRARMDEGRIPLTKALELARQVASGLAAAHAKGITHRDIKPENLFVTTDGRAKILDFGLAKQHGAARATPEMADLKVTPYGDTAASTVLASPTAAGMVLGTVGYMSPEQVRGDAADARSDIFSFGVVLYELLSGQRPFIGDTAVQTMNAILTEDPPEIVTTGRALPPALERVVRHCLEKKPDERFQSARDLAFALDALSSGSGTSSSDVAAVGAVGAATARRRWLPVGVGVGIALAAILGLLMMRPESSASQGTLRYSRFATEAESESSPAWSPDGLSIAYTKQNQIFVRDLASENARQLTEDGGRKPFWWPKSDRVGFLRNDGIWTVSAVGGKPTLLQSGSFHDASLSRDGTLAAWRVVTTGETTTATVVVASPAEAEFKEYTPAPFKLAQNFTTSALSFAPDGSELLLAAHDSNANRTLWRLPMPAGWAEPVQLFTGLGPIPEIAWLADSRRFIATAAPQGAAESQLWLVDAHDASVTPLTSGLVSLRQPSVYKDRVVLAAGEPDYDLVELPIGGGAVRDVFATGTSEGAGMWIQGTRSLVYLTSRSGRSEIRIRDIDTENDRRVASAPEGSRVFGVAPSPNGKYIAYQQNGPGLTVWVKPVDGGTAQKVTQGATVEGDIAEAGVTWSPDSNRLAVIRAEGATQVLRITQVGSNEVVSDLPLAGRIAGEPEWSPDGEWIAVPVRQGGIELLDPDGVKERRAFVPELPVSALAWSGDGKTLYATVPRQGTQLIAIRIDTGADHEVARFRGVPVGAWGVPSLRLSFNAEGTALLTTSPQTNTDLWILDNFLPPPSRWQRWFGR